MDRREFKRTESEEREENVQILDDKIGVFEPGEKTQIDQDSHKEHGAIAAASEAQAGSDADVEDSTGPRLLTRVFDGLRPAERACVRIVPQMLLLPPRWPLGLERVAAPYTRHHFAGTWKRDPARRRSVWERWIERDLLPPLWPARRFGARAGEEPR